MAQIKVSKCNGSYYWNTIDFNDDNDKYSDDRFFDITGTWRDYSIEDFCESLSWFIDNFSNGVIHWDLSINEVDENGAQSNVLIRDIGQYVVDNQKVDEE